MSDCVYKELGFAQCSETPHMHACHRCKAMGPILSDATIVYGMDRGMPIYDFPCSCGRMIRGTDRDRGKPCTHATQQPPTLRKWLGNHVHELGRWADSLRERPVTAGTLSDWEWRQFENRWLLGAKLRRPNGEVADATFEPETLVWYFTSANDEGWRATLEMALFTRRSPTLREWLGDSRAGGAAQSESEAVMMPRSSQMIWYLDGHMWHADLYCTQVREVPAVSSSGPAASGPQNTQLPMCETCRPRESLFYAEQKHSDRHGKECVKPPTLRKWLGNHVHELGRWADVLREQPVPAGHVREWRWRGEVLEAVASWGMAFLLGPHDLAGWTARPSEVMDENTLETWGQCNAEIRDIVQMALFTRHPDVRPEPAKLRTWFGNEDT